MRRELQAWELNRWWCEKMPVPISYSSRIAGTAPEATLHCVLLRLLKWSSQISTIAQSVYNPLIMCTVNYHRAQCCPDNFPRSSYKSALITNCRTVHRRPYCRVICSSLYRSLAREKNATRNDLKRQQSSRHKSLLFHSCLDNEFVLLHRMSGWLRQHCLA